MKQRTMLTTKTGSIVCEFKASSPPTSENSNEEHQALACSSEEEDSEQDAKRNKAAELQHQIDVRISPSLPHFREVLKQAGGGIRSLGDRISKWTWDDQDWDDELCDIRDQINDYIQQVQVAKLETDLRLPPFRDDTIPDDCPLRESFDHVLVQLAVDRQDNGPRGREHVLAQFMRRMACLVPQAWDADSLTNMGLDVRVFLTAEGYPDKVLRAVHLFFEAALELAPAGPSSGRPGM